MLQIAIDGPAGVGKSTVAKLVAKKLNINYIDTGAMYRAVAYKLLKDLKSLNLKIKNNKIYLDDEDITKKIRKKSVAEIVSNIAELKCVREKLKKIQRKLAKKNNIVMEGRDIGTVIIPNCKYKFYLDAKIKERIKRRMKDYKNLTYNEVKSEILARDNKDTKRKISPLKKAEDAIYIDTTNLTAEQVAELIVSYIK